MIPTKHFDFEGISRYQDVNIMLYKPKKDRGRMQDQYMVVILRLLGCHCFYINKMDMLCKQWECKGLGRYLCEPRT